MKKWVKIDWMLWGRKIWNLVVKSFVRDCKKIKCKIMINGSLCVCICFCINEFIIKIYEGRCLILREGEKDGI